jgi:ABC-2 type transport system permease protein
MRKTLVVALREYKAAVFTKAFILSLVMMPILMGGSIVVQYFLRDLKSTKDRHFAIIDRTPDGAIFAHLEAKVAERNKEAIDPETGQKRESIFTLERISPSENNPEAILKQRYELAKRVRAKELFGYLDVGADVLKPPTITEQAMMAIASAMTGGQSRRQRDAAAEAGTPKVPDNLTVRYYSNSPMSTSFRAWAEREVFMAVASKRAADSKLSLGQVFSILLPANVQNKELPRINVQTSQIEDGKDVNMIATFLVPFGLVMIMFMIIMIGASPLMQGVVEEKMNRIAEVLLGSISPFQLMLGKLLGGVGVAITLSIVYLAGGLWAAREYGFMENLSLEVVGWFIVFQAVAVLMFGSVFVAVGAACTDMKETQALLTPVMLIITSPMFVMVKVIEEPDSTFAMLCSLFPFATPMLMTARLAIPPGVPWWQPVLGIGLMLATTVLLIYIAGRIFRVGFLMQGRGATVRELVQWVVKA